MLWEVWVLLPRASGILDFNVLALFSLLVFGLFDCFVSFRFWGAFVLCICAGFV